MARTARTPYPHFPIQLWPAADRRLFIDIQGDGDPFSEKPAKSERNARSWKGLEYSYAAWLGFLSQQFPHLLCQSPAERVSQDVVDQYMRCLGETSSEITIGIYLQRLFFVIRDIAPEKNGQWQWLWLASRRLFKRAEKRPQPLLDGQALFDTGIKIMKRAKTDAEDNGYVSQRAATTFRKGLEIAFRSIIPERTRALQSLCLGESILKTGPLWRIKLEPEYTKSKKPLIRRIPPEFCPWITEYVERFRPAFLGADCHSGFWSSRNGNPMSRSTIYQSITQTTKTELGFSVSPHEFRRAVATRWHKMAPDQPDKPRRHLTHARYQTTKQHYIVPSAKVGDALLRALTPYKNGRSKRSSLQKRQTGRETYDNKKC